MGVGAKAIFVTGGASGIGRAVAERFAKAGWFVGLADVNDAGMAETGALLPDGMSESYRLDVRDGAAWDAVLAEFCAKTGGRLDVLFNNAGVARGGKFAQSSRADHDLLLDVNLKGVVRGAEAGYPYLKATPGSCLLNTCSAAGIYGASGLAVYAATKFGVRGLTEALEQEWRADGIKVRSLMPAFIETPLLSGTTEGTNRSIRETVSEAGLEISPVSMVADAAWEAVHSDKVHTLVGKTAKRLAFFARWAPGLIRRQTANMEK